MARDADERLAPAPSSALPGPVMRDFGGPGGWIEVICGVMFSGKSEELMRRVRRAVVAKKRCQVFKSHLDGRYGGIHSVGSHDGGSIHAEAISSSLALAELVRPDVEVVAI